MTHESTGMFVWYMKELFGGRMKRIGLIVVILSIAGFSPALAQENGAANAQQDIQDVKKQLEEQQKLNESLMERIARIEEESKKAKSDGDEGTKFSFQRPDGAPQFHRETPWADGEVSLFHYLNPSAAPLNQQEDLPVGLYYGSKSSFAEFHGFMNYEYFDFERQGARAGRSNHDLHHAYLSARAEVRSNLFAFLEIEYEHGNESEVKVDRALIDWRIAREFGIQFGERFSPFGIDKQMTALAPLKNSVSTPAIIDEFQHGDWPVVGAFVSGGLDLPLRKGSVLDYTIGAINGEGGLKRDDNGGKRDNNADKTTIFNLGVSPFVGDEQLGSLRLGFSHIPKNRYDADQAGDGRDTKMTGADLLWDLKGLHLRSEYVTRDADDDTANGIEGDGNGMYVEVAFDIVPTLTAAKLPFAEKDNFHLIRPFVRYNRTDAPLAASGFTTANAGEELKRWDIGILISPYAHFKFRIEYQKADEDTAPGGQELDNDGFLFNCTLDF